MTDACFKCGVLGTKVRLSDAIKPEGIVKICNACASKEKIPIIRKPTEFQIKESEKEPLKFRESVKKFEQTRMTENELLRRQDTTLKDIVDKNFERRVKEQEKEKPKLDVVENFNWIILRARRAKKLTQTQLAKEISESGAAIKLAEQGILPNDDYRLVNKIEDYLGIRLMKDEVVNRFRQMPRQLNFDLPTMKSLTISDLREMRKLKEKSKEEKPEFNKENMSEKDKANYEQDREMTEEEVDDILRGRK